MTTTSTASHSIQQDRALGQLVTLTLADCGHTTDDPITIGCTTDCRTACPSCYLDHAETCTHPDCAGTYND